MTQEARLEAARDRKDADQPVSYAMLDQTLWSKFQTADDAEQFLESWLAIQCRQIGSEVQGVLLVSEVPDAGPYQPVASWPLRSRPNPEMVAAAEQSVKTRAGVILGEGAETRIVAQPLIVFDQLYGVVVVSLQIGDMATAAVFRRLQWGAGWIEVILRREQDLKDGELRERVSLAFDMLATVLERPKFDEACNALVTDLARRLDCERVSIGFARRRRHKVKALSHSSGFGKRSNLVRDISGAMDEAADQRAVILWPEPDDWEFRVSRAHEELAQNYGAGAVLTVPLQAEGEIVGAIVFERPKGASFDVSDIEVCDAVASVVGPVLMDRKANDRVLPAKVLDSTVHALARLLGPSHFGTKLVTLALAAVVGFFWFARTDYSVSSPAMVEGTIQRTIVAPFAGYLAAQYASAGDVVESGEILAALDDKDLALDRLRLITGRQQRMSELDRALAARELAEVNIIRSQIDQTNAQLALIDEQLARTRIRAPFDGYVLEGDLSQTIGASLERGETLFRIAPLNEFRLVLQIDERDIQEISDGQTGTLRVSAMPETPLDYTVNRITPLAQQSDGRNWFRVEATLETDAPDLRPGMEGVARTDIDERLLITALTARLVDWGRLFLWKWQP